MLEGDPIAESTALKLNDDKKILKLNDDEKNLLAAN